MRDLHSFAIINVTEMICDGICLILQYRRCATDTQLLSHGEATLPDRCVRPAVRGRAGLLGTGCEPGGTVLLDDVHNTSEHAGDATNPRSS